MQYTMKKALGETQTLRAGRSNAGPKIFAPPQTPSRGPRRTAKIYNLLEMVTTCTIKTQFGEDRCMQFRVIVVTDTARPPAANNAHPPVANTPTDRTDNNTLRR